MTVRAAEPGQPIVIEATVAPGGGAPLHVHDDLDDSFYLVSGRLAMRCGEQAFPVEPGAYVALPHGVPHTFRVISDEPAVMLQIHTDDSFLRFIKAVGQPATSRTLPAGPSSGRPGHGLQGRRRDRPARHRAADERRGSRPDRRHARRVNRPRSAGIRATGSGSDNA